MTLTPAERQARYRAKAISAGKCPACCKRKHAAGKHYCAKCISEGATRRSKSRKAGGKP